MRKMKDSGIEWIGEIPENWERCKIKNIVSLIGSGTTPKSFHESSYTQNEISWIQSGDLYNKSYIKESAVSLSKSVLTISSLKVYEAPFIVIAMYGASVGNIAISLIDACCNQACCCIKPDTENSIEFMFYWLSICKNDFLSQSVGGSQPNISQQKIRNQYYYKPPLSEQQRIADFLDTKCSEIETLAADIQKEIDVLEEYKKSIIFDLVSHGTNHAHFIKTDSNVWSSIPENWKLIDIKYLFEIVKRIAGTEGYDVLSVTQKGLKVKDITSGDGQLANSYAGYQLVYPTDYVMNHMDLLTGWVDLSKMFGVTSPDYRVFRLRDKVNNNLVYYKYVMQCCYLNKIFYSLGQGVSTLGRWRLQSSVFNNFLIPVPPKREQAQIADFLDTKCEEIDSIIKQKREQLDTLEAYKKSLIYEYVTGKKEVMAS